MCKTLHKRLHIAILNNVSVIVEHVVVDIYNRLLYVANPMPEQINSHHWVGKTFIFGFAYIVFIAVLSSQILAKTQRLGIKPRFLQFYQHNTVLYLIAFALTYCSSKVNAKHRQRVSCCIAVFMRTYRHMNHFFLQQCRQHCLGYALILHNILKHGVVNRIGNMYYHNILCFNVKPNVSNLDIYKGK